jgi:short-subunit dehydrogenase
VFVKSFSDALRYEYQRDGITVQHLSPLFVNTKMNAFSHRLQETSLFVPDAATYSHNAVNTLGKVNTTTGYWAHGLQVSVMSVYSLQYIPQAMKMYTNC